MFEPFETAFPETASRDLKTVLVDKSSRTEYKALLPSAEYEFHELFCTDLECDCQRAILAVLSPDSHGGDALALIEMDLAPVPLHKRLFGAGKPRLLADPDETDCKVSPENSRHADTLLRLFSDVLAGDSAYIERLRRHRRLFREALAAAEEEVYPMPGGRPPLDGKAVRVLTRLYSQTRALFRSLHNGPIRQFQTSEHVHRAADRIGLLGKGKTIILESGADLEYLAEFSRYGLRSDAGETLVQSYARVHAAESDEPTRRLLDAMIDARLGVLQVKSIVPGLGAVVWDPWRDESGLLADLALAKQAREGHFVVGHYMRLPEFWMSTGGMVGVSRETLMVAHLAFVNKLKTASVRSAEALPPRDQEDLTAEIFRYIIKGKAPTVSRTSQPKRLARPEPAKTPSARKRPRHRSR